MEHCTFFIISGHNNKKNLNMKLYFSFKMYYVYYLILLLPLFIGDVEAHDYNLISTIKKVKPSIIAIGSYNTSKRKAGNF